MLFCRNTLLARRGTVPSGRETVDFPASASVSAASAAAEHKTGKFWRPFAMHSSSNSAAAAAAATAAVAGGSAPVSGSIGLSRSDAVVSSGSSSSGFPPEHGVSACGTGDSGGGGGGGDGGRGWRTQRSKRSLPGIGNWRRNSEPPASSSHPVPGKGVLSPPPRSRVRPRPKSISGVAGATAAGVVAGTAEDEGESARSWLSSGRRVVGGGERGTVSGVGVSGGAGGVGAGAESGGEPFEKVAKVPPWMEGVEASAEYDEIKPTLDVIKQTVLLAMLQQVGAASRPAFFPRGENHR